MFQTRHSRVAGIGNTRGLQCALNLLIAIWDIQRRTSKDFGATFLSGTVIVNALIELYILFKYLRPNELDGSKSVVSMPGPPSSPRKRAITN